MHRYGYTGPRQGPSCRTTQNQLYETILDLAAIPSSDPSSDLRSFRHPYNQLPALLSTLLKRHKRCRSRPSCPWCVCAWTTQATPQSTLNSLDRSSASASPTRASSSSGPRPPSGAPLLLDFPAEKKVFLGVTFQVDKACFVANLGELIIWSKITERCASSVRLPGKKRFVLDNTQIEHLIAEFAGQLGILVIAVGHKYTIVFPLKHAYRGYSMLVRFSTCLNAKRCAKLCIVLKSHQQHGLAHAGSPQPPR